MAQTPLFANIAELSALNVFTFLTSRFTVVSVPFEVIAPKTNQLTCHSFTGDLYVKHLARNSAIEQELRERSEDTGQGQRNKFCLAGAHCSVLVNPSIQKFRTKFI